MIGLDYDDDMDGLWWLDDESDCGEIMEDYGEIVFM